MTATYSKTSPYYSTSTLGNFLDIMTHRPITAKTTDKYIEIDRVYHQRPDMLAYDLYGRTSLWWVFAARNPDVLKDPLFDFVTGAKIYIPSKETLTTDLGV